MAKLILIGQMFGMQKMKKRAKAWGCMYSLGLLHRI